MIRKIRNYFGIYTSKDVQGMAKWMVTYEDLDDLHKRGFNVGVKSVDTQGE